MVLGGYACLAAVGEQVYVPPVRQRQSGQATMMSRLAALVKRVAGLHGVRLKACDCAEEFTIQGNCLLNRHEKLDFECPWLADPSREPVDGKMFTL
jgi:hypothetical protein